MIDFVEGLNPPGIKKKNRSALFKIIGRTGDIIASDINRISRSPFPFLCDTKMLYRHANALNIPQFPGETEEELRARASTGANWMEERGLRRQVYSILDKIVSERYEVFECPKDGFRVGYSRIGIDRIGSGTFLSIKVRDLTDDDYNRLYSILDEILDPDIEIIIVPWITAQLSNLTLEQIRLYGGSKWLASLYSDICYLEIRILHDDTFIIGTGRIGYSVVYPAQGEETILIYCADKYKQSVIEKTETLLEENIQWEVIQNG